MPLIPERPPTALRSSTTRAREEAPSASGAPAGKEPAASFVAEDPTLAASVVVGGTRERMVRRARELIDQAKSALAAYWAVPTHRQVIGLDAARLSAGAARLGLMALRTVPVAGNILNAVCALLDAAKATLRSTAFVHDDPSVHVRDLVGDWTKVAADVAGIFFPPAFLAGTTTSAVITAYGLAADHIRHPQPEAAGEGSAPTAPPLEPAP